MVSKVPVVQNDERVLGGLKKSRNQGYFAGLVRRITN